MSISDRLIELRKEQYLSIRSLCSELGVNYSNYSRCERYQYPDFILLSKLAIFYGLTLSGLLKGVKPHY
jgi:transcriptional regulator with XRE-family HTH domain